MACTRSGVRYQRTISLCPDELEFVEAPPKQLALECPICYGLLFNPHIVSCCGHHFCENCLERVKDQESPCPMCKGEFTSLRNKALQRDINQLEVRCPYTKKRIAKEKSTEESFCNWTGELGLLEGHLNIGNRMGDCKFVLIGCMYGCGHSDKRGLLSNHELVCPKRPYSCDYCGEYESTCEDVTGKHWKECHKYPIECPNSCQLQYLARGRLREHLDWECELEVVPCGFAWAGCSTRVQRCKLEEHNDESVACHLKKVCLATSNISNTLQELIVSMKALETEKDKLEQKLIGIQSEHEKAKDEAEQLKRQNFSLTEKVDVLCSENTAIKQEVNKICYESRAEKEALSKRFFSLESSIGLPPFSFVMDKLQQRMEANHDFFSPPFYSNIGGYRFQIKVTPNGIFFGEGTHISLTVYIMKGVFDDFLNWPFRGSITIAMIDQLNDIEHKTQTITFDKGTSIKASGRPKSGRMNEKGLVMYEFFDHAWLKQNSSKRKLYVKNDSLLLKVISVWINETL